MVDDPLKDLLDKQVREVDRMIQAMPIDSFLCVHVPEYRLAQEDSVYTATMRMHVIRTPFDCSEECRKTQYGPRPKTL